MRIHNSLGKDKIDGRDLSVSVEIFEPVVRRIQASLVSSDIEEGGKLLGKIVKRMSSSWHQNIQLHRCRTKSVIHKLT